MCQETPSPLTSEIKTGRKFRTPISVQKYERFLDDVDAVQQQQMSLLRHLIKEHGLEVVFLEGISEKDMKGLAEFVKVLQRFEPDKLSGDDPIDLLLLEQYRRDLLELGAAGRLVVSEELKAVRPVEDDALLKAANPVRDDGKVVFDEKINERRENAMVTRMLDDQDVAVVVLFETFDCKRADSCLIRRFFFDHGIH